jgi:hypothetical protein
MSYGTADLSTIQKTYDQIGKGTRKWVVKDDVNLLKLKGGENALRILPPSEGRKHFGERIFMHGRIGINEDQFLCKKMTEWIKERCPICEERKRLKDSGATDEEVKQFSPSLKWMYNVIDLDKPEDGVKVWVAPFTVGDEIIRLCYNRETRATDRDISHPDKGYNIFLTKEGEGLQTRYKGFDRDDQPSPLPRREWLNQLVDLHAAVNIPTEGEMYEALHGIPVDQEQPKRGDPVVDPEPFATEAVAPLHRAEADPTLEDLKTRIRSKYNR